MTLRLTPPMKRVLLSTIRNRTLGARTARSYNWQTVGALARRRCVELRHGYIVPTDHGYVVSREQP